MKNKTVSDTRFKDLSEDIQKIVKHNHEKQHKKEMNEDDAKKIIGAMPQNTSLIGYKTTYQNMQFFALLKGIEKKSAKKEIDSLL